MRIEVIDQPEGLRGEHEVWVKVLANSAVDWPQVQNSLSEDQREVLAGGPKSPSYYCPHLVTPEEREEHGYLTEDWFVFLMPTPKPLRSL
jgi:hypothetical protein